MDVGDVSDLETMPYVGRLSWLQNSPSGGRRAQMRMSLASVCESPSIDAKLGLFRSCRSKNTAKRSLSPRINKRRILEATGGRLGTMLVLTSCDVMSENEDESYGYVWRRRWRRTKRQREEWRE